MLDFIAFCIGRIIERDPNPESNTMILAIIPVNYLQFLLFVS